MAKVYLVGGGEAEAPLFISLEDERIVPSQIRAALPKLIKELQKKWPVCSVVIEYKRRRFRNPFNPAEAARAVGDFGLGLGVLFAAAAASSAGKKLGEDMGEEISAYVRRWIRSLGRKKKSRPRQMRM